MEFGSEKFSPGSDQDRPLSPTVPIRKWEEEPKALRDVYRSSSPPEIPASQMKMCPNCGRLYSTPYCRRQCLYYSGLPWVPRYKGDVKKSESTTEAKSETVHKAEQDHEKVLERRKKRDKDLERLRERIRMDPWLTI